MAGVLTPLGIETTAISFTYVTYILAAHEEMWKIMRAEVASADLQAEDLVDTLRKLPYLNAFLRVRLRREPVVTGTEYSHEGDSQSTWTRLNIPGACGPGWRSYLGWLFSPRGDCEHLRL